MTLLEIFERLGPERLKPGTQIELVDGRGRGFTVTMGETIERPDPASPFLIAL